MKISTFKRLINEESKYDFLVPKSLRSKYAKHHLEKILLVDKTTKKIT